MGISFRIDLEPQDLFCAAKLWTMVGKKVFVIWVATFHENLLMTVSPAYHVLRRSQVCCSLIMTVLPVSYCPPYPQVCCSLIDNVLSA